MCGSIFDGGVNGYANNVWRECSDYYVASPEGGRDVPAQYRPWLKWRAYDLKEEFPVPQDPGRLTLKSVSVEVVQGIPQCVYYHFQFGHLLI